jgi:hypothetical protein
MRIVFPQALAVGIAEPARKNSVKFDAAQFFSG